MLFSKKLIIYFFSQQAELSLQGDDFTRQIWHMYATFEEFIDHQHSPGDPHNHVPHQASDAPPPPAPQGGLGHTHDVVNLNSSYRQVPPHAMTSLAPPDHHHSHARDDLALASPRRSRRRRPRRLRRSVDNPLLDTISSIGCADSDEGDGSIGGSAPSSVPTSLPTSSGAASTSSSCCAVSRLHPETDSIGYAGSNSVDSGYKSACPTPELPDAFYHDAGRLEKRGSLASLASSGSSGGSAAGASAKPRIAMGTRVMARGGGVPRSSSAGSTAPPSPAPLPPRRPGSDGSYYELDQLAALRHALLTSPPLPGATADIRNVNYSRYSPRGSPAPRATSPGAPKTTHVSRRAASPASPERRPRSASTGSRCSPGSRSTRRTTGSLRSGSPLLASTGSLHRASSPGRRPRTLSPTTRDESRPPPAWSRHSSPGMAPLTCRARRPPSPIVGVDSDHESELAMLEREIDALLYGGNDMRREFGGRDPAVAQYYDLDSGQEFPCPYPRLGDLSQQTNCRPALAAVRRLRGKKSSMSHFILIQCLLIK